MSHWTHITACLSVDTYMVKSNILDLVKKDMEKAPKITGSEGDADVFINLQGGYNTWMSHDCDNCKYKDTQREVIIDGLSYTECDGPSDNDCSGKYQSCVVISVQGDLRDRTKEQTEKEFKDFLAFIENKYTVRDYSFNIKSE